MAENHNWADEAQNSTAPIKRRMGPTPRPGRLPSEFRASLVDFAADRIQSVWDDAGPVDAHTLAENVVMAQEFAWLSIQFPIAPTLATPTPESEAS